MFEVPQASQAPTRKPRFPKAGLSLCMGDNMLERGWQRRFEDPILLPDGRSLHTLRDAADYITGLPKEQSDLAQWQVTIEALILVARSGPTMLARMAFMKALNRNVVVAFDRDAKKYHWGKHKLKRDQ
jgi:hypothetical protein